MNKYKRVQPEYIYIYMCMYLCKISDWTIISDEELYACLAQKVVNTLLKDKQI